MWLASLPFLWFRSGPEGKTTLCRHVPFTVLGMFFVFLILVGSRFHFWFSFFLLSFFFLVFFFPIFGSVHFYWGSAKKQSVFCYQTKSRDVPTPDSCCMFLCSGCSPSFVPSIASSVDCVPRKFRHLGVSFATGLLCGSCFVCCFCFFWFLLFLFFLILTCSHLGDPVELVSSAGTLINRHWFSGRLARLDYL